jgi:hypothetical protein
MPQQAGLRNTDDIQGNRTHVDVREQIAELQSREGPLTLLTRRAETNSTEKPSFSHFESDLRAATIAPDASVASGDGTISISSDDALAVHDNMVLFSPDTHERMRVTNVDRTSDNIDVERGLGSSSAGSYSSGDTLVIIGNAEQEGANAPEEINAGLTEVENYTQIFRHSWSVTGTTAATVLDAGNPEWDRLSRQKSEEHARAIEHAMFFGVKRVDLSGENPRRYTGGLMEHIGSHVNDLGGSAITEDGLDAWAEKIFQYGRDRKFVMAGSNFINSVNKFARDDIQTRSGDDTFGLRVGTYETSYGTVEIVHHKLLSRYGNEDKAFFVDPDSLEYRPLENNDQDRDNTLRMNIQDNDSDALKSEYLTETGFEFYNEEKLGMIVNAGSP